MFAPATDADFEQLAQLRIAAMRESLERIGRFDPDRARQRLLSGFSPAHTRHLLVDGIRVGFIVLKPAEDHLLLDHLYIHPDHQGRGIGSTVLADEAKLPVRLCVLKESNANHFYQRHGFTLQTHGMWDLHYIRPWRICCLKNRAQMNIVIRSANTNDSPTITDLLQQLGYELDVATIVRKFSDQTSLDTAFVATCGESIVGCISLHVIPLFHQDGYMGRITSFVIDEHHRGLGIGRNLLAAAEMWFAEKGCIKVEVTSGRHRNNAHRFYEKNQYLIDSQRFLKRLI